jgi:hypothetical protein
MVRGPVRPPGQGLGDHDRRRGDLLQAGECKHLIAEEHPAAHPPSRPEVFLVLAPAAGLFQLPAADRTMSCIQSWRAGTE